MALSSTNTGSVSANWPPLACVIGVVDGVDGLRTGCLTAAPLLFGRLGGGTDLARRGGVIGAAALDGVADGPTVISILIPSVN